MKNILQKWVKNGIGKTINQKDGNALSLKDFALFLYLLMTMWLGL